MAVRPPFTRASALLKVRAAQDLWNTVRLPSHLLRPSLVADTCADGSPPRQPRLHGRLGLAEPRLVLRRSNRDRRFPYAQVGAGAVVQAQEAAVCL